MRKQIKFQCMIDCSSLCCGGATILTLKELNRLYRFFPVTIGFRKIFPLNSDHKAYIEEIAIKFRNFYIIGDFVAGNRLKKRCQMLKNFLCSINSFKPLQCSVIPFSVTFPEELQNLVIAKKRQGAFKSCKGFHDDAKLVWDVEFTDKELRENFYKLRQNFIFQRSIMEKIFFKFENNPFLKKLMQSEEGLFEVPIISDFIDEICGFASIDKKEFIKVQKSLFIRELTVGGVKNSLFIDALNALESVKI
ncbi:MAG: hypothetical protein QMD43_02745 [Thermodesulfovibrio sp.]|uniref:hypothetical protein n=1 Tax=Thermodesulfovibrio sp. N1 TaxID=1871110 RepID=UPI000B187DE5|nr:hypothetical protein [Thermodesulfovibrio sp. N1]MDI6713932.1 hypothetical protein [Thermodesulfovibrio sp.]